MTAVSIGLPVRNGEAFLKEALNSLLAQDFEDFEVVIADNASDDQTWEIAKTYAAADSRIRLFRQPTNLGAAANFNFVFEQSRGRFFKWAAHDDTCAPSFLRRCLEVFDEAGSDAVLVHTRTQYIDERGDILGLDPDELDTQHTVPAMRLSHVIRHINGANAVWGLARRDALSRTRLIDGFIASDYVLLAELAALGQIWILPEVLMSRRVHDGMSRRVNTSMEEVLAWFDPNATTSRIALRPRAKLLIEYHKSASRLATGWDRVLCLGAILPIYLWRRFRVTTGRVLQAVRGRERNERALPH